MTIIFISIFLFILFCFYLYCIISFSYISRGIFHNYISLVSFKTDWKYSFLEELAEKTRKYFLASFVSITKLKNSNIGKVIISSGSKEVGFLVNSIEKEEYYLQKKKNIFLPFIYKTEEALIHKEVKNIDLFKEYHLKHSFMIPIYYTDKKEEFFISFYFKNKVTMLEGYLKYFLVKKKISYFYASIFRNFVRTFENSTENLLEEIEDYVTISLNEDGEIVAWNKGAEKLFGYRSIDITKKKFVVLFNYGEEDVFGKSLEILKVKDNVKYFATLKDKMNIPIKVELKIKKLLTVTNELVGYNVFVRDITKEEIFKENIQQHSFINYTILENSQDGILILDADDKIIFYNQRVRIILDNSINLFGIPGKKIFPRRFGEEFEKTIDTMKESNLAFTDIDYCFENKYYNIRFFRVNKNSNNDYGGVIVFFIDESVRMFTMMELEEKKETLERINKSLLDALISARIMQETLIPKELPNEDEIRIEAIYELSDDLGGDFFYSENVILDDKKYNISFISDVSGHGISSSMMNVMVKEVYSTYIDQLKEGLDKEPLLFLQLLNRKLLELNVTENKFITCIIVFIDFENKNLKICSAGHTLPYYIKNNKEVELLDFRRAVPLGVIDFIQCETKEIKYHQGDKIIFYTDGFLDLFEVDDQKPSDSALYYLQNNKDKSIVEIKNAILDKYKNYKKEQMSYADDLTVLMIEFKK